MSRHNRDRKLKQGRKRQYHEVQPRDGDVVLHCGHVTEGVPGCHFFKARGGPLPFKRPDGSVGEAHWVVVCDTCFKAHGAESPIRGDAVWVGDEPIIEKEEVT